jgi:ABC-2 type transport system permease protein
MKFSFNASAKSGKLGVYSVVITAILLAVIVFANLLVNALPENVKKIDTTGFGVYTISETTEKYLESLDEQVTLNFICQGGVEDELIRNFIDRYAGASSNVTVKVIDPIVSPDFLTDNNIEDAGNHSVVVTSARRSKLVKYDDIFYYYSSLLGRMTYDELEYYAQMGYQAYLTDVVEFFAGESSITGAIEYVTAETIPVIYLLEGHAESTLSPTITGFFDAYGMPYDTLKIALDGDNIPEDCSLIIINAPTIDLTAAEKDKLLAYLGKGGSVLLLSDVGINKLQNFSALTAALGMGAGADVVYEEDTDSYYQQPTYIIPDVNAEHGAMADLSQYKPLMPSAHAVFTTKSEGITHTELLSTSDKAYTKQNDEKSEAQSFALAVAAEKALAGGSVAKFIWCGSANMITDSFINTSNGYNLYSFWGMTNYLCNSFSSSLPEISDLSLAGGALTVSEFEANFWGNILIFALPIATLVLGGVCVYKRKKR